jgi:hypothetical protein
LPAGLSEKRVQNYKAAIMMRNINTPSQQQQKRPEGDHGVEGFAVVKIKAPK